LNIAFGRGRITSPSTSMASFFGKRHAPSFQALVSSMGLTHGKAAAQGDPRNEEYTATLPDRTRQLTVAP
jgi:hypothetical protein